MQIVLASETHTSHVISFFKNNLDSNNSGVYSKEFLCPDGVKAAVRREQMLMAIINNEVVGAIRFYKKKTKNNISLYQYAISENYRGQGLFKKMLRTIHNVPIHAFCPIESEFNEFYHKTGWYLQETGIKFKVWVFND